MTMLRRHRGAIGLAMAVAVILWVVAGFVVQTVDAYGYVQWRRELTERHPGWRIPPSGRPMP